MKLPAIGIAGAFAAGIVLAGAAPLSPAAWLALTVCALLLGFGMLRRRAPAAALASALAAWLLLGALAARLEQVSVPADHVIRLLANSQLDTSEALRWRGRLRCDPLRLPWGMRYEIDLEGVEAAGREVKVEGGLRVTWFRDARGGPPPAEVRAGDRVEALVRARPPRNFLNPGAFDARAHLARQGIHLTGSLRSAELLRTLDAPPGIAHRLARFRGRLLEKADAIFAKSPERAAILKAMLLGDRSFVDHDAAEVFQKTGVYHVLVISGLHVAALAAFVYFFGRLLRLRQTATVVLTLAALAAFVAVVEDRPPIERAALMAGVFLFARLWFRRTELLNAIAVAAVIILAARPSALSDPSFQLSFLAVTMIGALALPWAERTTVPLRRGLVHVDDTTRDAAHAPRIVQLRLDVRAAAGWIARRLPQRLAGAAALPVVLPLRAGLRLWEIVLVSTVIQFGMLPLMAAYFHRVTLVGPLANIPAPLLSGLIVPAGFLALGAGFLSEAMGNALGKITEMLIGAMTTSVQWMGEWSWGAYRIPEPSAWLMAAFLALVAGLAWACRKRSGWMQLAFALPLSVCAVLIAVHPFAPHLDANALEVNVLDVGQGDSIFVAFPGGRTLVVDGGGTYGASRVGGTRTGLDIGEQVVSPYLWSRGIQRIDAVALTHAHQDHIDGLDALLDNFRVAELWIGREVNTAGFRALMERARARGVRVVQKHRGEAFEWSGVTGIALWPEDATPAAAAANNDSLVLRLEYGGTSVLLPGDIEKKVELEMVQRGDPLDVDFLKVPHHGSRTSASSEFLQAVTPQAAVMSFGENNPFNHPHPELLKRLQETGARVLRTDRDGAVRATSDGRAWRVRSSVDEIRR